MADLNVIWGKIAESKERDVTMPIMDGVIDDVSALAIGATSVLSSEASVQNNRIGVVELEAVAACWFIIGPGTPVAVAGACTHLGIGDRVLRKVEFGHKVAVIQP